jgi:hypothetical protein
LLHEKVDPPLYFTEPRLTVFPPRVWSAYSLN